MPERITRPLLLILEALMTDPRADRYGLEIMELTGLASGTLYPSLHRLVDDGWLVRTREAASASGGRQRRLYRLTALGERRAIELRAGHNVSLPPAKALTRRDPIRRPKPRPGLV